MKAEIFSIVFIIIFTAFGQRFGCLWFSDPHSSSPIQTFYKYLSVLLRLFWLLSLLFWNLEPLLQKNNFWGPFSQSVFLYIMWVTNIQQFRVAFKLKALVNRIGEFVLYKLKGALSENVHTDLPRVTFNWYFVLWRLNLCVFLSVVFSSLRGVTVSLLGEDHGPERCERRPSSRQ